MKISKQDILLLLFFMLFAITGLSRFLTYKYYENAFLFTAKWLIVPFLLIGGYYGYYCVYRLGPKQAAWRKAIGFIGISIFATLFFLKSAEGLVLEWNSSAGKQVTFTLKGRVSKVEVPRKKNRLFSIYSIEISTDAGKTITLETKNNTFNAGQDVTIVMKKGTLGLVYLRE